MAKPASSLPDWRLGQARARCYLAHLAGDPLPSNEVALLGGATNAMKAVAHKQAVSTVYAKRKRGELLTTEEAQVYLGNEERLRIARQGANQ